MDKVVVIMGSKRDLEHAKKILGILKKFEVPFSLRVASAHKVPLRVLEILKEEGDSCVYITIAGRSNALSAFVDWHTPSPVIACPPYSEKFGGADLFSSISMPSYVAPLLVLDPENAALAAIKILALKYENLKEKLERFKKEKMKELEEEDLNLRNEKF